MENNWIDNVVGNCCPVQLGTVVDVKYRDGTVMYGLIALNEDVDGQYGAGRFYWEADEVFNDIVQWRFPEIKQDCLDDALGTPNIAGDNIFTYPKTTFKISSEAELKAAEAARVNALLSEKLSTISDIVSKLTRKNFSVADIKLVKDLLESVEEYEENK